MVLPKHFSTVAGLFIGIALGLFVPGVLNALSGGLFLLDSETGSAGITAAVVGLSSGTVIEISFVILGASIGAMLGIFLDRQRERNDPTLPLPSENLYSSKVS